MADSLAMLRALLALFVLSLPLRGQENLNVLWPSRDNGAQQYFGFGFGLSPERLVVRNAFPQTPAYLRVYRLEGLNWIEDGRLFRDPADSLDALSGPIEVEGDEIAVGGAGRVHLFRRLGNHRWSRRELRSPDFHPRGFGATLVLDGERMAIGTDPSYSGPISLFVFRSEQGDWEKEQRLDFPRPSAPPYSYSMSFDDPYLAVSRESSVTLFERRGTTWVEALSVSTAAMYYHSEIGLDGSRLVVLSQFERNAQPKLVAYERGALGWRPIATEIHPAFAPFTCAQGRVYFPGTVLEVENGAWTEVGRLGPPDGVLQLEDRPEVAGPLVAQRSRSQITEFNLGAIVTFALDGRRETLHASTSRIQLESGGTLVLSLDAGPENAGATFCLAGSLEGTYPGFYTLGAHVPLTAHDPYFPRSQQLGRLDGAGQATVEVVVPAVAPGSALGFLKDRTLHHAFVVFRPKRGGIVHVSNVALTALVGGVPLPGR